jgi:hypothetical protein
MTQTLKYLFMTGLCLGAVCAVHPAAGYTLQYAGSGDVVQWQESCIRYSIHEDGAQDIEENVLHNVFRASFDAWENAECSYFYFEETDDASCDDIGYVQDTGNMNLIVFRESGWKADEYHDSRVIALTTVSWNDLDGRLLDADIEFNAEYFTFATDGASDKMDLQNTATHEIGHVLGLDESTVPGATMYPTANTGDTDKQTLAEDDIDGVCELYPLEDDPNTCRNPHCGLDLSCTSNECDKSGIGYNSNGGEGGCAAVPFAPRGAWLQTLIALLTTPA